MEFVDRSDKFEGVVLLMGSSIVVLDKVPLRNRIRNLKFGLDEPVVLVSVAGPAAQLHSEDGATQSSTTLTGLADWSNVNIAASHEKS